MESMFCATYHFFYRIEKEAGWGEDEQGNPAPIYTEIKINKATKVMTEEDYNKLHDDNRETIAVQLDTELDYITPIGRDEYEENTEDEE